MANIIVFLSFFVIYMVFIILYIRREVKKLRIDDQQFTKEKLEAELLYIVRNVLYITAITFIVNSYVLLGRDFNAKLSASDIGLVLAIGTFVFYVAFTTWDVIKYRIRDYFINKYNIEINKKVLFSGVHIIIIIGFSILLVEVVISIITIIAL